MEAVVTPEEMRAADEATISGGTPGTELMERAAYACATVALRLLGGSYGRRVAVVCGKGNNGGDGIACSRQLAAAGAVVDCFLLGEPAGDAAAHLERARATAPPGRLLIAEWSRTSFSAALARADLAVDAIFGTGFSGEPRGSAAEAVGALAEPRCRVLAVDIASGVSGADGTVPGVSVRADVTLAIQALKTGHVVAPGAFRCGRIDVAEIGIEPLHPHVFVPGGDDVLARLPVPEPDTHKYRTGVVAMLAGSAGMTGAAMLATSGALRSGAGLVFLGVPRSSLEVVEQNVVEAVKVGLPEEEGQLGEKAFEEFADRLDRSDVLAVGPGLGRGHRAVALVERALATELPLVIDGDGLWALGELIADRPDILRRREAAAVLTPHVGEFSYIRGKVPGPNRVSEATEAASTLGAVVHLKGRRAVTASPEGESWVNTTGNPGMATAGSGDVLTGIVATFVAQGMDAADAMWAAAYVHGLAGDVAADRLGPRPAIAGDIAAAVPDALRRLAWRRRESGRIRTVMDDPTRAASR